jgi:hypothetical protein
MLGERFRHCEYATTRPESGGTRAGGECLVEPRKVEVAVALSPRAMASSAASRWGPRSIRRQM